MDITLEQSLASAVRFIQDNDIEGVKPYFDELPEQFYVPSIYFPVPNTYSDQVSLMSYKTTIAVMCWFCEKTDWEANARAASVRDALLLNGSVVPVISKDGEQVGKGFHIERPELRRIDEGIIQLTFQLKDYFTPGSEGVEKIQNIYLIWHRVVSELTGGEAYGN